MNGPKVIDDIVIKNYEDLFLCLNPDKPDWFVAFEKAIFSIEMMDGQNSLDDIVSSLAQKYDLPKEELLKDLGALIETLKGMGMLEGSGVTFEATPPDITIQMAWMHITHRCNLRCKYCYITAGQEMENELTTEEIFNFIDQFHEMGGDNQTIAISGGEPLMREDFWDIVAHAQKYDISLIMATNGILVDEEMAERIKNNFCSVQVSLDGPREIHDEMRGKGSYDAAIKAIENFVNAGINPYINAVVTNKNCNELDHLVRVANKYGLASVKSPPLMAIGKGENSSQPTVLELLNAWWDIDKTSRELNSDVPLDNKKSAAGPVITKYGYNCGAAINSISLDSDGSIYPCQASQLPEFLAGNIREDSLQNIWDNSSVFHEWRKTSVETIEECSDCEWRYYCAGGCRMHAYSKHDTIRAPDIFCDMHKRLFEESIWTSTMKKMGRKYDVDQRWQKMVNDFEANEINEERD